MNRVVPIYFTEHQPKEVPEVTELIKQETLKLEGYPEDYMGTPKYLGIASNNEMIEAAYYIGATWIQENKIAAIVKPKIPNIDYLKMFADALEVDTENESEYFSKCYGIEFDKPLIDVETSFNIITPLILLHYISVLKKLTKNGLKKGYIYREENLQSKVKGHLLFQKHLRKNVIYKREDKAFCGFQEYTTDIPENRLLKKALIFANLAINNYESLTKQTVFETICNSINQLLSLFGNVSDDIEIYEVQSMGFNKLFAGYKEAVSLAKMILRKFDYSLQNTEEKENKTLPFWIDMPRLYELYVYNYLNKNYPDQVMFQVKGYMGTVADYILKDQGIILDAKYKPRYENGIAGIIPDIREMSGYARDEKILSNFDNPDVSNAPCVILYPSSYSEMDFVEEEINHTETGFLSGAKKIRPYRNFYKMKIELPVIKN